MISVKEALDELFALVTPLSTEMLPLADANGRVLAAPLTATRDQPPFAASAMDGYAVRAKDATPGATLDVIGEAAAGHGFAGSVGPGQACRIFTGAPIPQGADHIVIQEDAERSDARITLADKLESSHFIRPAGADFKAGDSHSAPKRLTPNEIALLAAMNQSDVPVMRKPVVAIIPTGDELVQPGETPGPDQIIASNSYGLKALLEANGAHVRLLPIARDTLASLQLAFELARDADLIITIGGASVGDHDLVGKAAVEMGLQKSFYKIAMRPGKPLMAGRMGQSAMIGLPGNPVSAMVCGYVFVLPMIQKMLGLGEQPVETQEAELTNDLPANGPREHYMRAKTDAGKVTVFERQDSALLSVLADANCLCIRKPNAPPARAGDPIDIIRFSH